MNNTKIKASKALRDDSHLFHHWGIIEYFAKELEVAIKKIGDPEILDPIDRKIHEHSVRSLIKHCLLLTGKDLQEYAEQLIHEQRNTSFGI